MSYIKFEENDIFNNVLKTHPKYTISFYLNNAYINNRPSEGQNVDNGFISLYEMNVDRENSQLISSSIFKGDNSSDVFFKSVVTSSKQAQSLVVGDSVSLPYPLTASISRELIIAEKSGGNVVGTQIIDGVTEYDTIFRVISLKNTFDYYRPNSKYYNFDSYILQSGGIPTNPEFSDVFKKTQNTSLTSSLPVNDFTNVIIIPSIFHGSGIKKGSIDLKFYYTGSLIGHAQDYNKNGEIIEVVGTNTGSVIGMALYNEGVLLITASHNLHSLQDGYLSPTVASVTSSTWVTSSSWVHFGAYKSFITSSTDPVSSSYAPASSSYVLEFEGTHKIPVMTMLCHANKNELNWSNNPTFLKKNSEDSGKTYEQLYMFQTSSHVYKEVEKISIKNTISSSFCEFSESYQPQTFISKIGIYDENKNLIAVAKLANPIRKTNNLDYTFKIKIDG